MTILNTRSKNTIVGNFAAGVQGRVAQFVNFSTGSVFLALAEAVAGVALWLQSLAITILKVTRLSTSYGADADSFLADFGIMTRLGAIAATGTVTFARYTATASTPQIPIGTLVKTGDGLQSFTVYADLSNSAYSAALNAYVMPASTPSLNVPVIAVVPGAAGNVAAGAASLIASAVSGVDTVNNPAGFLNGSDFETDAALKARFVLTIAGLRDATEFAIGKAISALGVGIQYVISSNTNADGSVNYGMVTVFVDDGSGAIPLSLLTQAQAAVNAVRAASIRTGVFAANILTANIAMAVVTGPGYVHATVVAQVVAALSAATNGMGLGKTLPYFSLASTALAVPGVTNITSVTLNGGVADLVPALGKTIKIGTLVVS